MSIRLFLFAVGGNVALAGHLQPKCGLRTDLDWTTEKAHNRHRCRRVNAHLVEYFDDWAQVNFGICSFWGARATTLIETAPVLSSIPTLLLVGDVDYATPPEWAKLTASTLSQSHIAEFPGIGHGVILADFLIGHCVGQLVGDFIDHPVAAPDMKCLDAFRAAPAGFVTQ